MRVLMPLPDRDFDVTETSVPWHVLTRAGHEVVFATEHGEVAHCDPLLLSGVVFGQLGAGAEPRRLYAEMAASAAFRAPRRWKDLDHCDFDALLLPGGHAQGMRQLLDAADIRSLAAQFMQRAAPLAAICHGVLVLARATGDDGRSLLDGRHATCLPKYMERCAYFATAWKLGRYYRTYPAYVEAETRAALGRAGRFERGPIHLFAHGSDVDDGPAFVVEDGNLVTARWPGDAWAFAKALLRRLPAAGTEELG